MHRSITQTACSQLSGEHPTLGTGAEACDRGVAGDQISHGISFPKHISKIKSGNFILRAIKRGMMLTIYMLHTCIADLRFIWQCLEAAPMAVQAVLTESEPSQ